MLRTTNAVKIAVILRLLRNAFAYTQDSLGDVARCSRPTINRIESLDKASPRLDTVDDLIQVFRNKGAEIQIGDEEVTIKFTKQALIEAEKIIVAQPASQKEVSTELLVQFFTFTTFVVKLL
ncbi:helix-turn-helix transcriptional regulator [Flavobacterium sp.]|jgi:DNA-binding XRE family transcriptional regulator|uniref:helix-turn-helix transcriptional regulator n=1 Tax=Flavobacterium sp. TaxID=239 RepID=UPI0037BF06DA